MSEKSRGYAHRIDIEADAGRVWRALTDARLLARWCAPDATLKPRAGGLFRASVDRVNELEALIDVFDAGRRLRLIHMPAAHVSQGESAVVDDVLLEPARDRASTVVRILGSGYPEGEGWDRHYLRLRTGWERALARLKVFLEKNLDAEG